MYSENYIVKLKSVQTKINTIYTIIQRHDGIVKALNVIEGQPALLMLLIAIASVRNFIAHDYDEEVNQNN